VRNYWVLSYRMVTRQALLTRWKQNGLTPEVVYSLKEYLTKNKYNSDNFYKYVQAAGIKPGNCSWIIAQGQMEQAVPGSLLEMQTLRPSIRTYSPNRNPGDSYTHKVWESLFCVKLISEKIFPWPGAGVLAAHRLANTYG
jgi:hypothetical protein